MMLQRLLHLREQSGLVVSACGGLQLVELIRSNGWTTASRASRTQDSVCPPAERVGVELVPVSHQKVEMASSIVLTVGEWMRLVGQDRDGRGDIARTSAQVQAGHRGWAVTRERLGNRIASQTPDGADRGVAEHMRGHWGPVGPRQARSCPVEDRVVPTSSDGLTLARSEHRVVGCEAAACAAIAEEQPDERG